MPIPIIQGEKIEFHPNASAIQAAHDFYNLSFEGGADYKNGLDAHGSPVFIPHEQESAVGTTRRKRLAVFRNYCKPIVEKYNALVFTSPIKRDSENTLFSDWSKNVDRKGTSFHDFMTDVALKMQKFGVMYVHVDSTKTAEQRTLGQRRDSQLYLIKVPPQSLVNWIEEDGILTEVIIGYANRKYVYYTAEFTQVFYCDRTDTIVNVEEVIPNSVQKLPIIKFCLPDNNSQISDVAELNKMVFNLDSLLMEELFKNTFTQFFIAGVQPDDMGSVSLQGRKFITIKKPNVDITPVSADAAQADSIRTTIDGYTKEMYRCAGLYQPDVLQNTESGRALKLRMNDVQQIAARIADNFETAENKLIEYWATAMNQSVENTDYPEDFQTEDLITELGMTLDILDSALPNTIKRLSTEQLSSNLFPKMSDLDKKELLIELESSEPPPPNKNSEEDSQ